MAEGCCRCFYPRNNQGQLFLASRRFYTYKNPVARPRTNPDKHRQNVAITLDPDLLLRSRSLAASKGRSLSQVLDSLLQRWITEQEPSDADLENAISTFIENHERREKARDRQRPTAKKKTAKSRA